MERRGGWLAGLLVIAVGTVAGHLAGCHRGHREAPPADAAPVADETDTRAADAASHVQPASIVPGKHAAKLRLTLRSTPVGASAYVDGHPVGRTPVVFDVDADGHVHQFAFMEDGFEPWRLEFVPLKEGVVHAALRPLPEDAGP